MGLVKLQFRPGINRDATNYSGEGGWFECDKVRFREGFPEKLGGWIKYSPLPFLGTCRHMHNWATTYSDDLVGVGTTEKFYIETGGACYSVTPLRTTTPTITTPNTNNCVATTNGSTTLTITLATNHLAATGDYVDIAGSAAVGGVLAATINANHKITVTSATAFTITVATAATSTVAAGGGVAITISFEVAVGNASTIAGYGWGTSTWGRMTWGLGSSAPIYLPQRDWFMDHIDNDLVFNYRNGEAYIWERGTALISTALAARAIGLPTFATNEGFTAASVPVKVGQLMVSQRDKHLIAFGAVPFGSTDPATFDPLLIRWSDQDNPGQWTPSTTNTAGDLRMPRGSRIVRGLPTRQETLVWTDTHLYALQFTGTSDVFALQEYSDSISIMSPRSMATANNITYWMGKAKFYAYTGRVETLPCTLSRHVFDNINIEQADQVICGTNEKWNEIWWFYPSGDANWIDSYIVFNHKDNLWYYGNMCRTAWLDITIRSYPIATSTASGATSGYMYRHEYGTDDDTSAMAAHILSSDFDLEEGGGYMLTQRVMPDIDFSGSTAATPEVTLALQHRNFPGNTAGTDSDSVVQTSVGVYTNEVFLRARARQMALKLSSSALGVQWQLGSPRLDVKPSGRK